MSICCNLWTSTTTTDFGFGQLAQLWHAVDRHRCLRDQLVSMLVEIGVGRPNDYSVLNMARPETLALQLRFDLSLCIVPCKTHVRSWRSERSAQRDARH
jgi:hypothetical protein